MRIWHTFAIVALAAGSIGAQGRADLAGTWKLNPELSAEAELRSTEDRAAIAGRRAPLGGGPIGMGGGGGRSPVGGSGYTGGRQNPEEVAKAREAMRLALLVSERLVIVPYPQGFVVTDHSGASHKWQTNGRSVKSQAGALTIDTKVKWDGATLVVERKFEGGVKATDRYSVSGTPRRLTIASKVEASKIPGEPTRTLRRVYDAQ